MVRLLLICPLLSIVRFSFGFSSFLAARCVLVGCTNSIECTSCLVACPLASICGCKTTAVTRAELVQHTETAAQSHVTLLLALVDKQRATIEKLTESLTAASAASASSGSGSGGGGGGGSGNHSHRPHSHPNHSSSVTPPPSYPMYAGAAGKHLLANESGSGAVESAMRRLSLQLAPSAPAPSNSGKSGGAANAAGGAAAAGGGGGGGGGGGNGSGSSIASVTETLRASLATSPLHDNKIPLNRAIPAVAVSGGLVLTKSLYVDVRDHVGKWLEAEIAECDDKKLLVHFVGWDAKWNEWIDRKDSDFRLTDFHRFSAGVMTPEQAEIYRKDAWIEVYAVRPPPRRWLYGKINKIDGGQLQVTYLVDQKLYQYWFHAASSEISPLRHN